MDVSLRNEVLSILNQLYESLTYFEPHRNNKKISLAIAEAISGEYAIVNCGNHFAFEEILIPYPKKMWENL